MPFSTLNIDAERDEAGIKLPSLARYEISPKPIQFSVCHKAVRPTVSTQRKRTILGSILYREIGIAIRDKLPSIAPDMKCAMLLFIYAFFKTSLQTVPAGIQLRHVAQTEADGRGLRERA